MCFEATQECPKALKKLDMVEYISTIFSKNKKMFQAIGFSITKLRSSLNDYMVAYFAL